MIKKITLPALLLFSSLCACKKENTAFISVPHTSGAFDISAVAATEQPGKYYDEVSGIYKLVLQPGEDGQDALIQWKADEPANANSNAGALDEIDGFSWTVYGTPVKGRAIIKFTGLNQVPATAKVLGAKLFLYGRGTSAPLPQGNSYYPGSPYNSYGGNNLLVKGITSEWDENTVTWNTIPESVQKEAYMTAPSNAQWFSNTSVEVTNLVKPMIADAAINNGFMLKLSNESIYKSIIFCSSEYADANKRPKIIVVYKL